MLNLIVTFLILPFAPLWFYGDISSNINNNNASAAISSDASCQSGQAEETLHIISSRRRKQERSSFSLIRITTIRQLP